MIRSVRYFLIIAFSIICNSQSPALAVDLTAYVGKSWETDKIDGKTFLQVPEVKANVTRAIGTEYWAKLLDIRDHRLKRIDDTALGHLIVLNQCKVGGCGPTALLMLKLNADFVGACFFDDTTSTNTWFGPNWTKTSKSAPNDTSECYGEDILAKFKEIAPKP